MKIFVTGATGFVGSKLIAELGNRDLSVRIATRTDASKLKGVEIITIKSFDAGTDWGSSLIGIDVVIHLAARVHVMNDKAADPLEEFRRVNAAGTESLARAAAASGVKRLVFVSSIKVNGESTFPVAASTLKKIPHNPPLHPQGVPRCCATTLPLAKWGTLRSVFSETDEASPQDPYGVSKWEAEQALHRVASETGLEVVIVRPPLVYGEGVKGNFAQLLKVLTKGIPLPLASVHNLRSLIYIGNFVDALRVCATHPAAAGRTYLVSDGEDVSTPDLLRQLGAAMGHPARLLPCPPRLLKLAGRLLGRSDQIERLLGSLQVDSSRIRNELGWQPPFTLQEGLRLTVAS